MIESHKVSSQDVISLPTWIVCPRCYGKLAHEPDGLSCSQCGNEYTSEHGIWNLLANSSDRFEDQRDEIRDLCEERANAFSAKNYYLPLFSQLFGSAACTSSGKIPKILFNGCGVGIEVDLTRDYGFDAYGIDCGTRSWMWHRRRYSDCLYIGNAKALPIANETFDCVVTGCLFPHIGVVGDSTTVHEMGWQERQQAANEIIRVLKPGGYAVMANPNRLCPVDLWHQGQMKNLHRLLRFHSPYEPFLLSFRDYQRLFSACRHIEALPISEYWGFHQKSERLLTRWMVPVIRTYFSLLSQPAFTKVRHTALNPWLIVLVQK